MPGGGGPSQVPSLALLTTSLRRKRTWDPLQMTLQAGPIHAATLGIVTEPGIQKKELLTRSKNKAA